MKRRLAAILSADVKGYSRLMGDDEEATVRTITAYRQVIGALVVEGQGRVVDSPGDNLLAEFSSVVDALGAAVEIQKEIDRRNQDLPPERKMEFRIGINLGDVLADGERIYGDGVNIAARLEGLAEPGGITISGTAYDQVESKLGFGYVYEGQQQVKNIKNPVRVYRVLTEPESAGKTKKSTPKPRRIKPEHRPGGSHGAVLLILLAVGILCLGVGLGWFYTQWRDSSSDQAQSPLALPPATQGTSSALAAQGPALTPLDKPSVVVLPFVNMSGEPEQEYFSDGITEDLITDLSKIKGLHVISRNSAFTYKGQALRVEQVSRELGVRYVVEGSVRKSGDRVRITAQLIEGDSGYHVWAERYDRELDDVFRVQDEVTKKIVAALEIRLTDLERELVESESASHMGAYDLVLRARGLSKSGTSQALAKAREIYSQALEQDPDFEPAMVGLGWTFLQEWMMGLTGDRQVLSEAAHQAGEALARKANSTPAQVLLGLTFLWQKEYDRALVALEKAVELHPGSTQAQAALGEALVWEGRPEEALAYLKRAIRLDPHLIAGHHVSLAHAYLLLNRAEEALEQLEEVLSLQPRNLASMFYLIGTYVSLDRIAEARETLAKLKEVVPEYTLEIARQRLPYRQPENLEKALAALKAAGLE